VALHRRPPWPLAEPERAEPARMYHGMVSSSPASLTPPRRAGLQPEVTKSLHAAGRALDAAREDRAQARRDRYAARQAHERAAIAADRLQRHVTELADRLNRMAELTSTAPRRPSTRPAGHCS
jgi:hypothetical protein